MPTSAPTIVVVHPKERRRKCTVNSLRGRSGFVFWNYPKTGTESLTGYVRLGIGGPLLSAADAERGLLILDGTRKLAGAMEKDFEHIPPRSLANWKTAYPRVSKMYDDPPTGLATIEALFAAYKILGRDCQYLLDNYHWENEFLEINANCL